MDVHQVDGDGELRKVREAMVQQFFIFFTYKAKQNN